jgi:hypothetical protein
LSEQVALRLAPVDHQTTFDDLTSYRDDQVQRGRETGLETARRGDPDGFALAFESIRELAALGSEFTADDVINIGSNAKGSAFSYLRGLGVIESVGFTTSKSVTRHGSIVRIWRGSPW